jgi:hypothetical protein
MWRQIIGGKVSFPRRLITMNYTIRYVVRTWGLQRRIQLYKSISSHESFMFETEWDRGESVLIRVEIITSEWVFVMRQG